MSEWPVFHMIGLPPAFSTASGKRLRALHVEDDRLSRARALEHVARVEDQDPVAPDDVAVVVDDADAIGVAVERDADLGAVFLHGVR